MMNTGNNFNKHKPKRIEKELLLLRNLPKEYKLGKRETPLGTLLYLEIDRTAVNSQHLDKTIEKFNFDILLRDKFPFQPPLIMTRTKFCTPSLADGRDLLLHIIQKDEEDWRPSMNLYELIQLIPEFIAEQIKAQHQQEINDKKGIGEPPKMIGKFHLGFQYDMNIWLSNQQCGVFPCQEEKESVSTDRGYKRKGYVDVYTVVTESVLLYLEPDHKIKNVARLVAWFTLPALEQIKRNLDNPDSISFIWRRVDDFDPLEFQMIMQNANECVNMIVKHLKKQGLMVDKKYEKKRKILESEVNESQYKELNINNLLATIAQYEQSLVQTPQSQTAQHLIMLYNKAIEYYSALNDEKHIEFLQKLQKLFLDDKIQKLMEVSDQGAQSSSGSNKKSQQESVIHDTTSAATSVSQEENHKIEEEKKESHSEVVHDSTLDKIQAIVPDDKAEVQASVDVQITNNYFIIQNYI